MVTRIRKYNAEDVKAKILKKFNGRYVICNLEEYNADPEKYVKVMCTKCNTSFDVKLYGLLFENHKCYCQVCMKNDKKLDFIKKVKDICGDEYVPLTEYKTCKDKVVFRHNVKDCMNEFPMTPDAFFNKGSRCPICINRQKANRLFLSHDEFESRIKRIHGNDITLIGKYSGHSGKIRIRHEKCGKELDVLCGDLLQGKSCRYCAGKMLKTTEQFKSEIYDLYKDEYSVIGEYKDSKTKIEMRHNLCGYEWEITPNSLLRRKICPYCAKSYGEKEMENFAIHNKLNYKTQETFEGCMDNELLKFDLSIYDNNNHLLCLVEYDGIGHFKPVQFGGISIECAKENYKSQIKRDKIKDIFCKNNNIRLFRISYKDNNRIYEILQNILLSDFKIKTEIPTFIHMNDLKSAHIKFIDMLNDLPNGIYPKSFFIKMLINENQSMSQAILSKPVVKEYMKNNNITSSRYCIFINRPCKNDYKRYIEIGRKNNFDIEVFNNISTFYDLPDGVYARFELDYKNKATRKSNEYEYYLQFLKDKNIIIEHSCVRINSDSIFARPNWLLEKRNEVV